MLLDDVTHEEWEQAKAILAEQQEAAKKSGASLGDISLKISRKNHPGLKHSFHYIQGVLVAGDLNWAGKGGSGKAKYAVDEQGTLYILRFQSRRASHYEGNPQRVMNKMGGVYYAYTRILPQEQDFFKKALGASVGASSNKEIKTSVKYVELFEAIGNTNVHDFLKNRLTKLNRDQRIILGIQAALALYDFHTVLREVHRDYKAPNMVINTAALEKNPLDFQVSLVDLDSSVELPYGSHCIVDGRAIGTPGYRSPDVCTGIASPEGDVFALGVTLELVILSPLITKGLLSENTTDLIDDISNDDPNDRPSIPDLVRSLWSEVSRATKDDFGNDAIVALHKRIRDLPPTLSPEEKEQSIRIDTPEELFTAVAMARWLTLERKEQLSILDKPTGTQWKNEVKLENVRILFANLDEDAQKEILTRCSSRMKFYITENKETQSTDLENLRKNLEQAIVFLTHIVEEKLTANPTTRALLAETIPLETQYSEDTFPTIEALVDQLDTSWEKLEDFAEYQNDPGIRKRFHTLIQLWSALPESVRLEDHYTPLFSFLGNVAEEIGSNKYQSAIFTKQTNVFRVDFSVSQMLSGAFRIANDVDKTDAFAQKVSLLLDQIREREENGESRFAPEVMLTKLRDLCFDRSMHDPVLSEGLVSFVEQVTGFDNLASEGIGEIRDAIAQVFDLLERQYKESVALYEGAAPTPHAHVTLG